MTNEPFYTCPFPNFKCAVGELFYSINLNRIWHKEHHMDITQDGTPFIKETIIIPELNNKEIKIIAYYRNRWVFYIDQ